MSADNFYLIRRHPLGGFAAVMGFASDDNEPQARESDDRYATVGEAVVAASEGYSEYGVSVHEECRAPRKPYVMIIELDDALLDGDDSIENAARIVNECLEHVEGEIPGFARPLSEIVAC